jgi:SAM-dependent methyltransferase
MSADPEIILEVFSRGDGLVLDLGGGKGILKNHLEGLGYQYVNLDIRAVQDGAPSIVGDAHALPLKDSSLNTVISKDSLEHFLQPWTVVQEVHRVLKDGGRFVILVPFMHPFHGSDYYRYTPLGLNVLLGDFETIHIDSPLWIFSFLGLTVIELLRRMHLGFIANLIRRFTRRLDSLFLRRRTHPASFAAAYRVIAYKSPQRKELVKSLKSQF